MWTINYPDNSNSKVRFNARGPKEVLENLEETLYVAWELTPTHRDWKERFMAKGNALFDYHGCEYVRVSFDKQDDFTFNVRDERI